MEKKSLIKTMFTGKNKYITYSVLLIIIIILSTILVKNNKFGNGNTILVERGNIGEEVLVSGIVKSINYVDLAFERNGTVSWVNKKVGNLVYIGETIVSLENGVEEASLENAEAQLKSEKAKYQEFVKGARPEEIMVKESELKKAEQDLENLYANVSGTIGDAYNKADNAVNKQADLIFSNDQTSNPDITFNVNDQGIKNEAIGKRTQATKTLQELKVINDSVLSPDSNFVNKEIALKETRNGLLQIQNFLIKVSAVLDSATNLDNPTLSSYKESVSTGRTNVNTAIQSVSGLSDDIASQKITREKISRELDLLKLGATEEVLAQQESAIMRAEANVKSAESSLRKTMIKAPITGTITKQDAKVGELVSAGIKIVSIINNNDFKIEANISEVDLPKIKIGNIAKVTLDAYGDGVEFDAEITSIDPAEEVKEGVPTYKTTFSIINPSRVVKSGMTANITIKTIEKNNVVVIPVSAVLKEGDKRFVNLINGKNIEKTEIQIGIMGRGGMVEIISGLSEGDRILKK